MFKTLQLKALPLKTLQDSFSKALMDPDEPAPQGVHVRKGAQLDQRFNIYRNNVFASLTSVLQARFPVIEAMVGAEFFQATARLFIEQHPPSSPIMAFYGDAFAGFLEVFEPAQTLPYLPDMARLEYARALSYHARDSAVIAGADLANVPPHDLERLVFTPHPSVHLITSPFPIVSLWQAHQERAHQTPGGMVGKSFEGAEAALWTRPHLEVHLLPITQKTGLFLQSLLAGGNLADALEVTDDFDLSATLGLCFAHGIFSSFHLS
jgi:hypothetical protein